MVLWNIKPDARTTNDSSNDDDEMNDKGNASEAADVIIVGGGIAGLTLALTLRAHCDLTSEIYEQAPAYEAGTGGALGLYPNGLRVFQDVSASLLSRIRGEGYDHVWRRWYRPDGTEVARGREGRLTGTHRRRSRGGGTDRGGEEDDDDDDELAPLSIRRWKLQKILYEEALRGGGVTVHFDKRLESVERCGGGEHGDDNEGGGGGEAPLELTFADGTNRRTRYLFGADGIDSRVRDIVVGPARFEPEPEYTGVTVLYGTAPVPRPVRGVCFAAGGMHSSDSGSDMDSDSGGWCHISTYPTGKAETTFELYVGTDEEHEESWGPVPPDRAQIECAQLADELEGEGWDASLFVDALRNVDARSVVRVGLCAREPLTCWVSGSGDVALLGDAAHPPVPYIGQGANVAVEDAGTIALLLKRYCCCCEDDDCVYGRKEKAGSSLLATNGPSYQHGNGAEEGAAATASRGLEPESVRRALRIYERMRIPRTKMIFDLSQRMGDAQRRIAESSGRDVSFERSMQEWTMKMKVWWHGTLPIMLPGATSDYREEVEKVVRQEKSGRCWC